MGAFCDGKPKSEGRYIKDEKTGYWFFWNLDSKLKEEGHLLNNLKTDW